jgi:lipopolysaccharide transport system permease protein
MKEQRHPLPIAVYEPESPLRNPLRMIREMGSDLVSCRGLAWQLIVRDIRTQYRQAALGLAWAFLLPAANAAIWLLLRSSGAVHVAETAMPYAAFVISGTLLWSIFMDAVNAPLQQVQLAKPMLAKINFRREALLLSGIGQTAFNATIKLIVLAVALLLLGIHPGGSVVLLPVVVSTMILLGSAVGLALVPVGLLYSDIGRGLPLLLQFLMFLCPVVYPVPDRGHIGEIMRWNPLTPLLEAAREALSGASLGAPLTVLAVLAFTVVVLLFGWLAYRAAMPVLIERMSA